MWRSIYVVVLILAGGLTPADAQSVKLEKRSVLGGKAVLLLPVSFELMDEERLRIKYPTKRPPKTVYTNRKGTVNVAINHTSTQMLPAHIPAVHKSVGSVIRKSYPSGQWYRNELVQIGGKRFFMFDFRSPAIDTEIRNLMVGTSFEGRLLLVTFNTVSKLESTWAPIGNRIINSIRIGG